MTHLAVHVAGALQPDRIADLLDRERRGNRHDELPGNNRRRDAFQRPGVASQSPVTPSPTSSTTPAGPVVLLDRAVLQLDVRVGGQVVIPDRVPRCPTQGGDDRVLTVVL